MSGDVDIVLILYNVSVSGYVCNLVKLRRRCKRRTISSSLQMRMKWGF